MFATRSPSVRRVKNISPSNMLSREHKGKSVAIKSSPDRDQSGNGSPLDNFSLIHHDALKDVAGLDALSVR